MAINIQAQGWLVFESGRIGMVGPPFAVCRGVRTARYSFTVVPVARVVAMRAGDPHRGTALFSVGLYLTGLRPEPVLEMMPFPPG